MKWLDRVLRRSRLHLRDGELMALVDRQLPLPRAAFWKQHLHACDPCRSRYDELRHAVTSLRGLAVPDLSAETLLEIRQVLRQAVSCEAESLALREAVARCLGRGIAARLQAPNDGRQGHGPEQVLLLVEAVLGRRSAIAFTKLSQQTGGLTGFAGSMPGSDGGR